MIEKSISSTQYFRQIDNKHEPFTACYNTSMGMLTQFCLDYLGTDKKFIGCPVEMQIEDYIYEHTESKETKRWIKKNVSVFGSWILEYRPRTIAVVEEMVFNKLMKNTPFRCKFCIQEVEAFLDDFKAGSFPVVLHGDFHSVSTVQGHIVMMDGFIDREKWLIKDPFGNAMTGYKDRDGSGCIYPRKFFLKKKNKLAVKKTMVWHQKIIFTA